MKHLPAKVPSFLRPALAQLLACISKVLAAECPTHVLTLGSQQLAAQRMRPLGGLTSIVARLFWDTLKIIKGGLISTGLACYWEF